MNLRTFSIQRELALCHAYLLARNFKRAAPGEDSSCSQVEGMEEELGLGLTHQTDWLDFEHVEALLESP